MLARAPRLVLSCAMTEDTALSASPRPEIGTVTLWELFRALREGWRDFTRAPMYGLFFSAFYVLCGAGLIYWGAGTFTWTLVLALGFPIFAPFAAVGLYEVSAGQAAAMDRRFAGHHLLVLELLCPHVLRDVLGQYAADQYHHLVGNVPDTARHDADRISTSGGRPRGLVYLFHHCGFDAAASGPRD